MESNVLMLNKMVHNIFTPPELLTNVFRNFPFNKGKQLSPLGTKQAQVDLVADKDKQRYPESWLSFWSWPAAEERQPGPRRNLQDPETGENLNPTDKPASITQGCCLWILSISKQTQWVAQAQVGSLSSETPVPALLTSLLSSHWARRLSHHPTWRTQGPLDPVKWATKHAHRLTSWGCLLSSPVQSVKWPRQTWLQKCWERILNGQSETCPNFYCYF